MSESPGGRRGGSEFSDLFDVEPAGPVDLAGPEAGRRLAEGYYATNFLLLLEAVAERHQDLLEAEEREFIERFRRLEVPAQRLYVRLIMRKGPIFRRDRLDYPEIPRIEAALASLRSGGWIDSGEGEEIGSLLSLLLRRELLELLRSLDQQKSFGVARLSQEAGRDRVPSAARRDELIAALSGLEREEVEAALRARIEVIRPLGVEVLWVLRLLFFGNLEQDLQEFVLRDLGVQRYEAYPLNKETRLFESREALDDTLALRLLRLETRTLLAEAKKTEPAAFEEAVDLASLVLRRRERWHPLAWRHGERVLIRVARELERSGRSEESLELYAAATEPPARERRARVLARLGRETEALVLCQAMEQDPLDATEGAFAPFFAHRLRRKLGLTKEPWRRPRRPVETLEVEASILAPPRPAVEWITLALLEERGRRGIYSENWLWRSLFGLAFWDLIFLPIPGAFAHPFQWGPLDLQSPEFYRHRRSELETRFEELEQETDLESRLGAIYQEKHGTANAFVAWHPQLEETLRFAMAHIAGAALAMICRRLAQDPGRHRRGLPDLLVLDEASPVGFELLEVKAPGDQLRPEQGAWLDYLNAHGIPAKILRLQCVEAEETPDRGLGKEKA